MILDYEKEKGEQLKKLVLTQEQINELAENTVGLDEFRKYMDISDEERQQKDQKEVNYYKFKIKQNELRLQTEKLTKKEKEQIYKENRLYKECISIFS